MSAKKINSKEKKKKKVVEEEVTQTTWDDVVELATQLDGLIRTVARGTLEVKENKEIMEAQGEELRPLIDIVAKAVVGLKEELLTQVKMIPPGRGIVVVEDQYPIYHMTYSNLIELNDRIMEEATVPFSSITSISLTHIDKD